MTTDSTLTFAPPHNNDIVFMVDGVNEVIRITAAGQLVKGEGLSEDEATQQMFLVMAQAWPSLVEAWALAQGFVKP